MLLRLLLVFSIVSICSSLFAEAPRDSVPMTTSELEQFANELEVRTVSISKAQRIVLREAINTAGKKFPDELQKILRPILDDDETPVSLIAIQILSSPNLYEAFIEHDNPIVRFDANYQLAKTGDIDSAVRLHKMLEDSSMAERDSRFIVTRFLACGLNPKSDTPMTILEHLKSLARPFPRLKTGELVPNFKYTDVDGNTYSLRDHRGKIVVVHFWAQWCGPCMEQMDQLCKRLSGIPKDKVVILFVNLDFDLNSFNAERKKIAIDCRHICDEKSVRGDVATTFGVNRIPVDVVIDAGGRVASYSLNSITETGEIQVAEDRTKP